MLLAYARDQEYLVAHGLTQDDADDDDGTAAEGSSPRLAYDMLADGFGPGFNGPLTVVVEGSEAPAVSTAVAGLNGVSSVGPTRESTDGGTSVFTVVPTTGPDEAATVDLVSAVRMAASQVSGDQVSVSGLTAA